jgi:hypothetical protein
MTLRGADMVPAWHGLFSRHLSVAFLVHSYALRGNGGCGRRGRTACVAFVYGVLRLP